MGSSGKNPFVTEQKQAAPAQQRTAAPASMGTPQPAGFNTATPSRSYGPTGTLTGISNGAPQTMAGSFGGMSPAPSAGSFGGMGSGYSGGSNRDILARFASQAGAPAIAPRATPSAAPAAAAQTAAPAAAPAARAPTVAPVTAPVVKAPVTAPVVKAPTVAAPAVATPARPTVPVLPKAATPAKAPYIAPTVGVPNAQPGVAKTVKTPAAAEGAVAPTAAWSDADYKAGGRWEAKAGPSGLKRQWTTAPSKLTTAQEQKKYATAPVADPVSTIKSTDAWTAAQKTAKGRWEAITGQPGVTRQWVPYKAPAVVRDPVVTDPPVVKDPVVVNELTPTTGGPNNPDVITNHSDIGPNGTDLGVIGAIGGTPSINNPNGTVTSIVSKAVNHVVPNITTEAWNKIKTKTHADLLNSPDPVEKKIGEAISHYTVSAWKSFDNAIGVGRKSTRSNSR